MSDPLLASWILDFLLAQPSADDRLLRTVLSILPFPSSDPHIRKRLLLRRLQSCPASSERSLETLELLEDIDAGKGANLPDLAAAYVAVAVDCAVRRLREGDGFEEAVGRIWSRRIGDMLMARAGLRSPELEKWKIVLDEAVWNGSVRKLVMEVDTEKKATEAVAVFVERATKEIGKPVLEIAAEILLSGRNGVGTGGMAAGENPRATRLPAGEVGSAKVASAKATMSALEVAAEMLLSMRSGEGANQADVEANAHVAESGENKEAEREHGSSAECLHPCNNVQGIASVEVSKVKKALRTSCSNLLSVVKDPLPDSIATATALLNTAIRTLAEPKGFEQSRMSSHGANGSTDKMGEVVAAKEAVTGIVDDVNNGRQPKFSLMDRNPTAQTYEWGDDSVDLTSELQDTSKKIMLPSPRRHKIVPLNPAKVAKFSKRRTKKWWTEREEGTLREAVAKYGAGSWKFILNCHPTVFEGRTEVDLKDKWRNMTRYGAKT